MLLENWILNLQDLQPHANLFLPLISPDQLQQTPRPPFTVVRQNCQNLFSKIVTSFNPQLCHGNLCLDSLRFKYRTELDSRCSLYHWEIFMWNVLWQSVSVTSHYSSTVILWFLIYLCFVPGCFAVTLSSKIFPNATLAWGFLTFYSFSSPGFHLPQIIRCHRWKDFDAFCSVDVEVRGSFMADFICRQFL